MNNCQLIGRLVKDPVIKNRDDEARAVCRYTLAVGRPGKGGEPEADFINIVCFSRAALTAAKFFRKGVKIGVTGRLHSGSYQNQDGRTVYYTEVVASLQEFCEKKQADTGQTQPAPKPQPAAAPEPAPDADFMHIPDNLDDYLPFN